MPIRSDIAWSTADEISVRGLSLPDEIIGHMGLGEMVFLNLTGRRPTPDETAVFEAIVITLVEHGITPSALAARLTYTGAPESLQAAVAAGLCGLGSRFVGSMEGAAAMLQEALPDPAAAADADLDALARDTVAALRAQGSIVPGLGHPVHKPIDPRTPRLFALAADHGFAGPYVDLVQRIGAEAERASGRVLPINATGALGALCCELGFPAHIVRGFGVMARALGLVAHILEEHDAPIGMDVWLQIESQSTEHVRPG